ncbi:MAG: restriction endonuclease subunit S [Desulfobulbaceae bacterium]
MAQLVVFPRHESYKDSGSYWLGEIPSDWSVESIRSVTQLKSKKNQPDLQVLSVYRDYGVILKDSRDDNHNATSLDTSGYKVVNEGDLVVNKMKAWQGSMGVSEYNGIVSPAYITCQVDAERVFPKFLHYLLRSQPYIGVYNALSYGVRVGQWDMHYEDFKHIPLPLPDRDQQQSIANFLDQKTAEIDEAIAKKQRLIELLKEQKTIRINQAVTKGLNPDAPMHDSGVEWIGEVPKHWKISALGYITRLDTGATPDRSRPDYWNGSIPWIKTGEIKYNTIVESEEHITELGLRNSATRISQPGTVLMAMYGQGVTRGRVAILGIDAAYNQACVALAPCKKITSKYLYYFFIAAYGFIRDFGNETSQMNLSSGIIRKIKVLLPEINEQTDIVNRADEIEAKYTHMIKSQIQTITLLSEFKQALIASAVTGKIKI